MKIQLTPEKMVEAELVGFVPMTEPWAEYHLDNGRVLRFRALIYRVLQVTSEKAADGSDLYLVQSMTNFVVNESEERSNYDKKD